MIETGKCRTLHTRAVRGEKRQVKTDRPYVPVETPHARAPPLSRVSPLS